MKDRYEWENNRNKDIERKAYRILFLSTLLIPLTKYLQIENSFIIIILTLSVTTLFFCVIKLRRFLHPLDPFDYFDCKGKIKEDIIQKDLNLSEKELVETRVREYLKCAYYNKKVAKKKLKYLHYMSVNLLIQMFVIFILFTIPFISEYFQNF